MYIGTTMYVGTDRRASTSPSTHGSMTLETWFVVWAWCFANLPPASSRVTEDRVQVEALPPIPCHTWWCVMNSYLGLFSLSSCPIELLPTLQTLRSNHVTTLANEFRGETNKIPCTYIHTRFITVTPTNVELTWTSHFLGDMRARIAPRAFHTFF